MRMLEVSIREFSDCIRIEQKHGISPKVEVPPLPVLLYLAHSYYVLSKTIGLWDQNRDADGNIPINYDFALGNNFSDDFKTLFTDAVEWFHRETCLRFVEIEPSDDADFLGPVFNKLNRFLILVQFEDL